MRSGKDYKHLSEGDIPVYGTGGYMLSVNEALSYDEDAIGIGRKGTIDKPYVLRAPFWTVDTLFYAVPRENIDLDFAFDIFQNIDWKNKDESTGVPSLSKTAINEIDVLVPQIDEQVILGRYFASLDHLITLHQREYSSICNHSCTLCAFVWEQRKVGELLIERNEQAPMSSEYPLMAFIANEGVAPKGERYDRSSLVSDAENKPYKKTQKGDFIYSSNNLETGSIGLNKYGNASISPVYSIFYPTGIADSDFLGRRLVRRDFINEMVKWRQGVIYGQWRIHESDFLKIEIPVPSIDEQKAIGLFLDDLDRLITLHQRKSFFIKIEKKSFQPQFLTNSWEQRKLGDLGSVSMCKRIFKEQTHDVGDVPFFKIGTFGGTPDAYISMDLYEEYKTKYPYPLKGAILISASGSIGRTVEFTGEMAYFQDSNIVWLSHDNRLEDSYLKVFYEIVHWAGIEGSTIKRLYNDNILKTNIMLPSVEEQRTIGVFFDCLDNLITLHQRESFYSQLTQTAVLPPKFAHAWEQRKVGELLIERNEQAPMSSEYPLMAFIANEGVAPKGERYDRSSLVSDAENKPYKKTQKGDFIYSSNNLETGSIGLNKYGNASISPVYSIFYPTGIADSDFLGRRLVRRDFINEMVKWRQGVIYGQWRIHESDFLKIEIPVPSIDEQKAIGLFLDDLDRLITLHQRKPLFSKPILDYRENEYIQHIKNAVDHAQNLTNAYSVSQSL